MTRNYAFYYYGLTLGVRSLLLMLSHYSCDLHCAKIWKGCSLFCLLCWHWHSLIPRLKEEEEKGPGFSHLCMCLIVVEFHRFRILLIYFHTLVTSILMLSIVHCLYICHSSIWYVKKLTWLYSSSGCYRHKVWAPMVSADKKKRLFTSKIIAGGNLSFHCTSVCPFC